MNSPSDSIHINPEYEFLGVKKCSVGYGFLHVRAILAVKAKKARLTSRNYFQECYKDVSELVRQTGTGMEKVWSHKQVIGLERTIYVPPHFKDNHTQMSKPASGKQICN